MTTVTHVVRRPAVAGYYYPADPQALRSALEALMPVDALQTPALAALVPHGSLRHSGAVTGRTLARIAIPRRCMLIGPSHTGQWMPWSVMTGGAYRTPLGDVPIDEACAEALRARCPFLSPDPLAQRGEHAIEVPLPFLQRRAPADLTVVPIIAGSDDAEELMRLAEALAQVVSLLEERVLLIASTDLSHSASREEGAEQDRRLIERLCQMDPTGLIRLVREESIPMCGYGAAACVLAAAARLGAGRATLEAYGTSAEWGGDPDSATGYAGLLFS